MKTLISLALFSVAVIAGSAAAKADQRIIRHLVYNFTSNVTAHVTKDSAALDSADYSGADSWGSNGDTGTITVDVVSVQSDTGLVVNISQQGRENRSASAATCVVYGTTMTVCDPNKKVLEEEVALLRLLGRNFVNPATLDAQKRWHVSFSDSQRSDESNFQITTTSGNLLHITEDRLVKTSGLGATTDNTTGMIVYDSHMSVPTALDETLTSRVQRAQGLYSTDTFHFALNLAADSMAAKL